MKQRKQPHRLQSVPLASRRRSIGPGKGDSQTHNRPFRLSYISFARSYIASERLMPISNGETSAPEHLVRILDGKTSASEHLVLIISGAASAPDSPMPMPNGETSASTTSVRCPTCGNRHQNNAGRTRNTSDIQSSPRRRGLRKKSGNRAATPMSCRAAVSRGLLREPGHHFYPFAARRWSSSSRIFCCLAMRSGTTRCRSASIL